MKNLKKLLLTLLALSGLLLGLLAPPATAAESAWNDGKSDSDLLWNCVTETYGTGVSANTGWWSPTGEVPKVGEPFMVRGYIGYIGTPCAPEVAVVPELIAPAGLEYIDEEVRWDIAPSGEAPQLKTGGLEYWRGINGGAAITQTGDEPFILKRGEVLEFQFPVRATREMKGSATQQPECDIRVAGDGPCPVAQSGDHFQIAFAVGGHGGSQSYVIPYVGLFAAKAGTSTPPATKAASTTTASYALKTGKRGKAVVTVKSSQVPTGRVVVLDKGRTIGTADLAAAAKGKVTIRLPKMKKGVHKLVVKYLGSAKVKPSQSSLKKVTLR